MYLIMSPRYIGGDYVFVPVRTPPPPLLAADFVHGITFEQYWGFHLCRWARLNTYKMEYFDLIHFSYVRVVNGKTLFNSEHSL